MTGQAALLISCISYNNKIGKYSIAFDEYVYEQRLCEFLNTFNFLKNIDLEEHLLNTSSIFDSISVPISLSGNRLILSIQEYISFRELYMEEMYRLKLENMLAGLKISFGASNI